MLRAKRLGKFAKLETIKRTSSSINDELYSHEILISVVIPAFNEEANLPIVIEETIRALSQHYTTVQYELLLVDDGSSDATGRICDDLTQQYPCIRVFHHPTNQGFGAALRTGFINARGVWVSYIGADGEITIEQVIKLYNEIGGADLIVSCRQEDHENENVQRSRSLYRKCLTVGLRYLLVFSLGFNFSGKEGIFMIRNNVLKTLHLCSNTGLLAVEIIMQCYHKDLTVKESCITVYPRLSGQSKVTKLSTNLNLLWEVFKLRFKSLSY